jgi:CheY-like chemotaxis protein
MHFKNPETVPILLVEDDPGDVAITRRAFKKARIANRLHVVRDGEEAMEFLQRTGRYGEDGKEAPRPGLILLDLNLPRIDGHDVLRRIKKDPALHRIPVVVLTTSSDQEDLVRCYDEGANTYITKPVEFENFLEAVTTIERYWLCVADIPDQEGT